MAHGRKTGGRQKGARNLATAEARAAAEATGILPLDYMLSVMRDANADDKRRDAMATAAAPYLHSKLLRQCSAMRHRFDQDCNGQSPNMITTAASTLSLPLAGTAVIPDAIIRTAFEA